MLQPEPIDESKIIVTDDFLPEKDFAIVRDYILGNQMSWYWVGNYAGGYPLMEHVFYSEKRGPELHVGTPMVNTTAFRAIDPVIARLQPASLIRVRANCNWRTNDKMQQRDWHTDVPFECQSGIYYMHDSDACTVFKDGTNEQIEVETKENRFIQFPSTYEHAATPFTEGVRRVVLNINFHINKIIPNVTTITTGTSNPEHW
jgi:hypothetical protein